MPRCPTRSQAKESAFLKLSKWVYSLSFNMGKLKLRDIKWFKSSKLAQEAALHKSQESGCFQRTSGVQYTWGCILGPHGWEELLL